MQGSYNPYATLTHCEFLTRPVIRSPTLDHSRTEMIEALFAVRFTPQAAFTKLMELAYPGLISWKIFVKEELLAVSLFVNNLYVAIRLESIDFNNIFFLE